MAGKPGHGGKKGRSGRKAKALDTPMKDTASKDSQPGTALKVAPPNQEPRIATIDEALLTKALLRVISDLGLSRATKLTPTILKILLQRIKDGNYIEVAAESCGISVQTLANWRNKAKLQPESLYADIVEALKKAQGLAETDLLAEVRLGGKFWPAPMTILERSHPDRWSLKRELNVNLQLGIEFSQELYDASHAPEIVDGEVKVVDE